VAGGERTGRGRGDAASARPAGGGVVEHQASRPQVGGDLRPTAPGGGIPSQLAQSRSRRRGVGAGQRLADWCWLLLLASSFALVSSSWTSIDVLWAKNYGGLGL
jgi:hypothetical protein